MADYLKGLPTCEPLIVRAGFTCSRGITAIAPPAELLEAGHVPIFDDIRQEWHDSSIEAQTALAEEAQKQVTLQGEQLKQVGEVLTAASSVISAPSVAATISDSDALKLADLWPTWAVGQTYSKGQVVIYDEITYRHHADSTEVATEQLNPKDANYLWAPIVLTESGDVVWVQPEGYEGAYAKGAIVLYSDGKYYQSQYDGNDQDPSEHDARYWVEVNKDGSPVEEADE